MSKVGPQIPPAVGGIFGWIAAAVKQPTTAQRQVGANTILVTARIEYQKYQKSRLWVQTIPVASDARKKANPAKINHRPTER